MKITIIGAGWMGCHLANKLKQSHTVTLYERAEIFSGTSSVNQNRLHTGYHYARNSKTREMCKNTFIKFIEEYGDTVSDIPNNLYCIPERESLIDFDTYVKIFQDYDFDFVDVSFLDNVEGSIAVNEKYINPIKAKKFFEEQLSDHIIYENINDDDLDGLSEKYDLIINCTNNQLNSINDATFEELCDVFVYSTIDGPPPFGALTFVDGNFFSIFPYLENTFTVTDVAYTPALSFSTTEKIKLIEEKIIKYYPEFSKKFIFKESLKSLKVKNKNNSASRVPTIQQSGNIINCFTGKIQGIYIVEEYLRGICEF